MLNCIDKYEKDELKGKKVLVRVDFNIPIEDGVITEEGTFRIKKIMRTINYLKENEACIILISHIGKDGEQTLRPVFEYIQDKYFDLGFVSHLNKEIFYSMVDGMGDGSVILLENLRKDSREKENDPQLASELSEKMDLFINEAFSVSHRKHTSIVSIPRILPSYIGFQFKDEKENLEKVFNPEKPFGLILGGAKFGTKLKLLEDFLPIVDWVFVGGALTHSFLKAKGFEIGKSFIDDSVDISHIANNEKIILADKFIVNEKENEKSLEEIKENDIILDISPDFIEVLTVKINESKIILWNGPMGKYESNFVEGTQKLAKIISRSNLKSIVGGGDTVTALLQTGALNDFTFVSTAGGAMLDFLVNKTLPGIEVLL